MPGDRTVALVPGELRARVVARTLAQVVDVDALDDVLRDADLRDADDAERIALGRDLSGGSRAGVVGVGTGLVGTVERGRGGRRVRPRQRALGTAAAGRSGPGPGRSRCPRAGRRRTGATAAPRSPTRGRPPRARCAWAPRLTGSVARPRVAGSTPSRVPFVDSWPSIARRRVCLPSSVCRSAVCLLGRFPALAGVDLDAASGEIVLLSGANGAGKTTLLRLLAGLVPLYSGEATVLGHDLAHDRRGARRDLALVGHETFCYDDLTVRENLRFAAQAAGRDRAEADVALERLGLARLADVVHGRLSAGQRRRLAVAVALSRDPRLLLLDEPHAGLDAEGRAGARCGDPGGAVRTPHRAARVARARRTSVASRTREVVLTAGQARLGPSPTAADVDRSEVARREPLARGPPRRGEGPADRGAVARHGAADHPLRADRAPAVRVRARSRPGGPSPGRARPVLGDRAARRAPRRLALVRDRGRQRRPRRSAPLGPRRAGAVPREGRRGRGGAAGARGRPGGDAWCSSTASS